MNQCVNKDGINILQNHKHEYDPADDREVHHEDNLDDHEDFFVQTFDEFSCLKENN